MSRKAKGTQGENEVLRMFWKNGWACIRTAGSGSNRFPAPDLLAGNGYRRIAIECKITKDNSKYLTKDEIKQLVDFSRFFGAESWVGIRFAKNDWFFLNPEDLKETDKSFMANIEISRNKGLLFEELIN